MSVKKSNGGVVIERLENGACVTKRICKQCGRKFVGERNLCRPCCNQQRLEGKFGPTYHKQYYRRRTGKAVVRPMQQAPGRAAALERHQRRIRCDIETITQAGFDPDNTPLCEILDAGVELAERLTTEDTA